MFELGGKKQENLVVRLGIPTVYSGVDVKKPPLTAKMYRDLYDLYLGKETFLLAIRVSRNRLGVSDLGRRACNEIINEIYELSEINDPQEFVESLKLEIIFG